MMLRGLALFGRHGTWFLAGGLFIGLLAPPLARLLHPALGVFIFALTTASFLAIDWPELAAHARRPGLLVLVVAWTLLVVPVLTALAARAAGVPAPLAQALVLWAASPPLISLPAIALLLGLDGALALLAMVGGTFLIPLTLPPLVLGLIGIELGIDMTSLMLRLALFIGGAALTAAALRRLIGGARLRRRALELSGLSVLILLVFAIAVMDGANALLVVRPQQVLLYAGVALAASLALQGVSFLAFAWLPRVPALTVGLIGGNNNLGMVWANLGGAVTPELALFFAAVQLPIYVLPVVLKPAYRRLGAGEPHGTRAG